VVSLSNDNGFSFNGEIMKTQQPLLPLVACVLLAGCSTHPLAPTNDMARTSKIAIGQPKADVESTMARPARTLAYALKPDETVQVWRVEDHFVSRCLFVTYDKDQRVKELAVFERERDERGKFGTLFPGSC
jgi:hypothetical protein